MDGFALDDHLSERRKRNTERQKKYGDQVSYRNPSFHARTTLMGQSLHGLLAAVLNMSAWGDVRSMDPHQHIARVTTGIDRETNRLNLEKRYLCCTRYNIARIPTIDATLATRHSELVTLHLRFSNS